MSNQSCLFLGLERGLSSWGQSGWNEPNEEQRGKCFQWCAKFACQSTGEKIRKTKEKTRARQKVQRFLPATMRTKFLLIKKIVIKITH